MLKAIPAHWFSWDFNVLDGDKQLALIDLACLRESAKLVFDGVTYKVYRERTFGGAFLLETEGRVIARGVKPSAWRRAFEIEHGARRYTLKAESGWGRSFVLLDGEMTIGAMRPEHAFTRRATVDFPDSIPLPVRVFLVWLTIIIWKRDSDSAAAGSASS